MKRADGWSDYDGRFSGLPVTTEYVDGRTWVLAKKVCYVIAGGRLKGRVSTLRRGFRFDWASVPRPFWHLVPPAGLEGQPYGLAALWHDWLYVHGKVQGLSITRKEADAVFLEIMLYVGTAKVAARLMYLAVRAGGWCAWSRYRAADNARHDFEGGGSPDGFAVAAG